MLHLADRIRELGVARDRNTAQRADRRGRDVTLARSAIVAERVELRICVTALAFAARDVQRAPARRKNERGRIPSRSNRTDRPCRSSVDDSDRVGRAANDVETPASRIEL